LGLQNKKKELKVVDAMNDNKRTAKRIAFIAIMSSLANVLSLFSIPIALTSIHLTQLPIILAALSLGRWDGGLVGFVGGVIMAYRLTPANPYILFGNAILGYFTGYFFSNLKKMKTRPIIPHVISVLAAFLVQAPYLYLTDVYLILIPSNVVLTIILPKLLIEGVISVLICHLVLFRFNVGRKLK
jgi:uncharacterized membrane protein